MISVSARIIQANLSPVASAGVRAGPSTSRLLPSFTLLLVGPAPLGTRNQAVIIALLRYREDLLQPEPSTHSSPQSSTKYPGTSRGG
jgi:hypothetical protein